MARKGSARLIERVRKVALALPGTTEKASPEHFFVRPYVEQAWAEAARKPRR
jgi:hypothetical protein